MPAEAKVKRGESKRRMRSGSMAGKRLEEIQHGGQAAREDKAWVEERNEQIDKVVSSFSKNWPAVSV